MAKVIKEMCTEPANDYVINQIVECMNHEHEENVKALRAIIRVFIGIEIVVCVLIAVLLKTANVFKVIETGYPIIIIIIVLAIPTIAGEYITSAHARKKVISDFYIHRDTVMISNNTFRFDGYTDEQMNYDKDSRSMMSVNFRYKDGNEQKKISFGKHDGHNYYDELINGYEYRFITVNKKHCLVVKNNDLAQYVCKWAATKK